MNEKALHLDQNQHANLRKLSDDHTAVILRAYARVAAAWGLSDESAASLIDISQPTYSRAKKDFTKVRLGQDQITRLSFLIGLYKGLHLYFAAPLCDQWVSRPNDGAGFDGRSPLSVMQEGGLLMIEQVRRHIDALRGGA